MGIAIRIGGLAVGSSSGSSWTPQNFLTTNLASDNVTALNDALTSHRSVYINTPGVYEIDDTIWIPSNTRLKFCAGCSIKKATGSDFTFVFANKGILTYSTDSNITLLGNGLTIIVNNITGITQGLPYRMRGHLGFLRVNGLNIDGITNTDNPASGEYTMHLAGLDGFLITNINFSGLKDGLHFDTSKNGIIQNIITDTKDDALAFMVSDYASTIALVGGFDNIQVINWQNLSAANPGGHCCITSVGSWKIWETGVTYYSADLCVNNGRIYVKINANGIVSANAPVHTVGQVTGADGITWDWVQDGTITEGIINNITFQNCSNIGSDVSFNFRNENDLVNQRSTFPGTEGNSYIDNLVIDNYTWNPSAGGGMINNECYIKKITIKNSDIDISAATLTCGGMVYSTNSVVTELIINNCDIKLQDTSFVVSLVFETETSVISKLNIIDSVITGAWILGQAYGSIDIAITNTELINCANIISEGNVLNASIIATNCTFTDPVMVVYYDRPTGAVTFTSTGCHYTNPSGLYLWYANNSNVLTINVTSSTGVVNEAKITGPKTIITACDLIAASLGAELINQSTWMTLAYWDGKDACWTSDGVKLNCNGSGNVVKYGFLEIGKTYKCVTSVIRTSGTFNPPYPGNGSLSVNATGTFVQYKVANLYRDIYMTAVSFIGSVPAISIKEVLFP